MLAVFEGLKAVDGDFEDLEDAFVHEGTDGGVGIVEAVLDFLAADGLLLKMLLHDQHEDFLLAGCVAQAIKGSLQPFPVFVGVGEFEEGDGLGLVAFAEAVTEAEKAAGLEVAEPALGVLEVPDLADLVHGEVGAAAKEFEEVVVLGG